MGVLLLISCPQKCQTLNHRKKKEKREGRIGREGSPCRTQVSILLILREMFHKSEPSEILTTTLSLSKGKGRMTIYTVLRLSCSSFVASQNANFKGVSCSLTSLNGKTIFFPSRGSLLQPSAYKTQLPQETAFLWYQLEK